MLPWAAAPGGPVPATFSTFNIRPIGVTSNQLQMVYVPPPNRRAIADREMRPYRAAGHGNNYTLTLSARHIVPGSAYS